MHIMRRTSLLLVVAIAITLVLQLRSDAGQDQPPRSSRLLQHFDETALSKPAHRVRIENDVRVTMRDGVGVSVDIYRPDAPGRFPSILIRTPYNNNTEQAVVQGKWFA
jgi:predicted acyl esterase